jgi:hypothetical protein
MSEDDDEKVVTLQADDEIVVKLETPQASTLVDAIALDCVRRVEAMFLEHHEGRALRLAKVQAEIKSALLQVSGQLI